jgi:hypothetical protein
MSNRTQCLTFVILGILVAVAAFIANSGRAKQQIPDLPERQEVIRAVPNVVSKFPSVRVKKVDIRNAESPFATIAVEVENAGEVGIIAITLESKKDGHVVMVSLRSSFEGDADPRVVIEPHEVGTLEIPVANTFSDVPLEIGSVMYANGSEVGDPESLKTMHKVKDHEKKAKTKEFPQ